MKILLTGSEGFIGRAVVKALDERNIEHVAIDRSFFDELSTVDEMHDAISLVMVDDIDAVIHLGAISNTLLEDANEMMLYNYLISKIIFDCAAANKAKVVFASSASIYGDARGDNMPLNMYGWSKLIAEDYGINKEDLSFISLRYFNVFGPGEGHKGKMASVAYQAYKQFYENGLSFQLFRGYPRRDFIYIDDAVSATIHALLNVIPNGYYDVGTGEDSLFEDVLNALDIPYEYYKEGMAPEGYQWFTCANKSLWLPGWKPKYDLLDGLNEYRKYLDNGRLSHTSE